MLDRENAQPAAETAPAAKVTWVLEEYGEVVDLLLLPEGTPPPGPDWKRLVD